MNTVGELMDELAKHPRSARISVRVEAVIAAGCAAEDGNFAADIIRPFGCNPFDLEIFLGGEI